MKLTEEELTREIKDCAKYLREKAVLEVRLGLVRPTCEDIEAAGLQKLALYDYAGMIEEINGIAEKLTPAIERLNKLSAHFSLFRLQPYADIEGAIESARTHVVDAQVQLGLAINQMEGTRPPKSKAMTLQKSAVRLAHAILGASQQSEAPRVSRRPVGLSQTVAA